MAADTNKRNDRRQLMGERRKEIRRALQLDAGVMVSFKVDSGVWLREFTLEDARAVFDAVIANRDHLSPFMHWMTPGYSIDSANAFIQQAIEKRAARKSLSLGILRGERFIGSIGFVYFDWVAGKAEIGYWISADEEGKGIVAESARMLIDFAFRELELNRIEIRCSSDISGSAVIALRLGFTREGLLRIDEFSNGRLHDFEICGLLASEWKWFRAAKLCSLLLSAPNGAMKERARWSIFLPT